MNSDGKGGGEQQEQLENASVEELRNRVESLWRQAQSNRGSARSDLYVARATRAGAELERHKIAAEALKVTKEACRRLINESERHLVRAREVETSAVERFAEAKNMLQQAQKVRSATDSYREDVLDDVHRDALRIRRDAIAAATEECTDLKRKVMYQVQSTLAEIDALKAATQEELEAQRIYAETPGIQVMSQDIYQRVVQRVVLGLGNSGHVSSAVLHGTGLLESMGVERYPDPQPMHEPAAAADEYTHDGPPPSRTTGDTGGRRKSSKKKRSTRTIL